MSEFHIHSPNFTTIHVENHTRQELNESLDAAVAVMGNGGTMRHRNSSRLRYTVAIYQQNMCKEMVV